ncbi:MAG: KUP/HAK/KT family potassium transporter, partial [Pseudomonadota bacterium]
PDAIENPFFLSAPNWALYPLIALSTAAAVIASQAVISAAFSITRQAMQLGFVPRFEVRHTSDKTEGQIYMPGVNWILMLAVMGLVLGFKSSTNMAAAYGIAVTGNMVATSLLACIVAAKIWRWGWLRAVVLFSLFLLIELSFLSANIEKIPDGGWFSLVIGLLVLVLMTTWKRGRQLVAERLSSEGIELEPFIAALVVSMPIRVQGTAVFMNASSTGVPHALMHNLMHNKVLHERVVIASVQVLDVPYVVDLERVEMHKLEGGFYKMLVRYGFKDEPDIPRALELCAAQGIRFELMETSFFLGRETLIPKLGSDMALWREKLFIAMFRNASSATAFFKIPSNRVVELGTQLVL